MTQKVDFPPQTSQMMDGDMNGSRALFWSPQRGGSFAGALLSCVLWLLRAWGVRGRHISHTVETVTLDCSERSKDRAE